MSLNDNKSSVKLETTKRDLIIKVASAVVNHNGTANVTFKTAFPNACWAAIPFCDHPGFASASNLTVDNVSKTGARLFQTNTAGVVMTAGVIAFGY